MKDGKIEKNNLVGFVDKRVGRDLLFLQIDLVLYVTTRFSLDLFYLFIICVLRGYV